MIQTGSQREQQIGLILEAVADAGYFSKSIGKYNPTGVPTRATATHSPYHGAVANLFSKKNQRPSREKSDILSPTNQNLDHSRMHSFD
jgi:hypothetical protein